MARGGVWLEVVFVTPPRVIFLAVSRHLQTKRLQVAPPRGKRHLAAALSRKSRPGLGELGAADVRGEEIIRSCYFLRRILEATTPRTPVPAMAAIALLARSASPVFGVASFLVSFFASFFSSFFGSV